MEDKDAKIPVQVNFVKEDINNKYNCYYLEKSLIQ